MNFETEKERFQDNALERCHFADEFLIVCPKCARRAKVLLIDEKHNAVGKILFAPRKMVCLECGHSEVWEKKNVRLDGAFDWYFRQPLWLQIPCCQNVLWAYNMRHLEFIEGYVGAKLRQRRRGKIHSVASKLPKWIKDGKNRDEILKCIGRLKGKSNE
jgi:predicted nucleic-acid-binding Zn-ribbon protein